LAGAPRPVGPIIEELIAQEKQLGLDQLASFRSFAARINNLKTQLLDQLDKLRTPGTMVAGYGASATVTTLLHHFELGDKLSFIVDDNPRKQGTFSPGHHIPVLAPTALAERRPD